MNEKETLLLIKRFNQKSIEAFGEVYNLFYEELFYYASKLYGDTDVDNRDVIHDILLKLWQAEKNDFTSLEAIKAYLLLSIKNARRTLSTHMEHVRLYSDSQKQERFEADVLEIEILSTLHHALGILPPQSAEILSLFLHGWSAEEIAEKLDYSKQTVYNKKAEAIAHLKKKLSSSAYSLFMSFFNFF